MLDSHTWNIPNITGETWVDALIVFVLIIAAIYFVRHL